MTEHTRAFLQVTVAALALFLTGWVYWPGQSGPALLDDATSVMVIRDLREQPELAWDYVTGDKSGPLGRPVSVASFVLEKMFFDDSLIVSKRLNICLHLFNGVLLMGLFWQQSKEFGEKAVNHAENMKNTTDKASALQKQINQQIKQQENLLKNLPE